MFVSWKLFHGILIDFRPICRKPQRVPRYVNPGPGSYGHLRFHIPTRRTLPRCPPQNHKCSRGHVPRRNPARNTPRRKTSFIETGDDFPHQFQSVFSQYMIMLFQFVKLQPVFFRYRAGNLQLFRGQLDSLFPVPYFHDILSVIYGEHIVLAGFFRGQDRPTTLVVLS